MTAKRILIVDDDRETCRLIAELVGGPGRTLEDATVGGLGIHLMRQFATDIAYEREGGRNRLAVGATVNPGSSC